nr:PREDICTED: uncharacterized protein LOC100876692 [Megachile rotundata]
MPIAWTTSKTLKLVTLYSEHECLRNPLHPDFKNKLCRYKAYKNIVDRMNVCGLTVCDCIKRITFIKAQYCHELSKICAAISCEKFYKPTASWFLLIHQLFFPFVTQDWTNDLWKVYLHLHAKIPLRMYISHDKKNVFKDYQHNETNKQLNQLTSMELGSPGKDCGCPYANCRCNKSYTDKFHMCSKNLKSRTEGENITTDTNYLHLFSQKVTHDVGSNNRKDVGTEHAVQTDVSSFTMHCTTCQVCLEDNRNMKNMESRPTSLKSDSDNSNNVDKTSTDENNTWKKEIHDEFHMFGKSIAFQLRNMDFGVAIKLEKRIQDLIAQERLDNIKSKCSECYASSSCSECEIIQKEMICSCGLPVIMIKTDQSSKFRCK